MPPPASTKSASTTSWLFPALLVEVHDNDTAGVIVTQINGSTDVFDGGASPANARVELDWSLVGLWCLGLYAQVELAKHGIDPQHLSMAGALRAFRRTLRDCLTPGWTQSPRLPAPPGDARLLTAQEQDQPRLPAQETARSTRRPANLASPRPGRTRLPDSTRRPARSRRRASGRRGPHRSRRALGEVGQAPQTAASRATPVYYDDTPITAGPHGLI